MPRRLTPVPGLFLQILSFGSAMFAAYRDDSLTASVFLAACFVIATVRDIERERRNAR